MRYQSKNSRKATKLNARRNAFRAGFLRDFCKAAAVPPALLGLKPRRIPVVIIDEVSDVPTLAASALEAWTKCPRRLGSSRLLAAPYGQQHEEDLLVSGNAYAELARATGIGGLELSPRLAQQLHERLKAVVGRPLTDLVIDEITDLVIDELKSETAARRPQTIDLVVAATPQPIQTITGRHTTEVFPPTPPTPPGDTAKYYIGCRIGDKYVESEVSRAEFCKAERSRGFRPRERPGRTIDDLTLATGGFSSGDVRGRIVTTNTDPTNG